MHKVGKVTLKSLSGHFNDLGGLGSVGASADHNPESVFEESNAFDDVTRTAATQPSLSQELQYRKHLSHPKSWIWCHEALRDQAEVRLGTMAPFHNAGLHSRCWFFGLAKQASKRMCSSQI